MAACSSDPRVVDSADPTSAASAGAAPADRLVGGEWKPPTRGSVGSVIVRVCGATDASWTPRRPRTLAAKASEVRTGSPFAGVQPTITVDARTSALVFGTSTAAQRFVDAVSVPEVRSCAAGAINEYLRTRDPGNYDSAGPVVAANLATRSTPVRVGDHARAFEFAFPEELIGGSDNSNSVDVIVGQRGPVVAAAIMVSSRQVERRSAERALARRLAEAALARATKRLG